MKSVGNWFNLSAGVILFITGVGKLWSALGNALILEHIDPILNLQFAHLMVAAGVVELIVAIICFFSRLQMLASSLIAWLATSFLVYRMGLWWIGWHRPCACLGNFADALHISPQVVDMAMKIILAYLVVGSYGSIFWLWRQRKKVFASASA